PSASSNTQTPWAGDGTQFTINVNTRAPKDKAVDLAAHELGHVLGAVFHLPGHDGDPRVSSPEFAALLNMFGPTPAMRDAMVESEEEGWALAEKIHPELDQERKRWALGTYERA